MPNKPVLFDQDAANKIANVVQQFEPPVSNLNGKPIPRRKFTTEIYAKITGSELDEDTDFYFHTWVEQRRTAVGWEDAPDGLTDEDTAQAMMPDGSMLATSDTPVTLKIEYLDTDEIAVTVAQGAGTPQGTTFVVRLSVAGGVAGGFDGLSFNSCSYTYVPYAMDDVDFTMPLLETGALTPPFHFGIDLTPAEYGLCYYDSTGAIKLAMAFETPNIGPACGL